METLLLYALVTPALFYLGSRAVITSWLWAWYPPKLASFMDCSACSGTWYGALVAYIGGYHLGLDVAGLQGDTPVTVAFVAVASMTWTPIIAGLVQKGFDALGSIVTEPEIGPGTGPELELAEIDEAATAKFKREIATDFARSREVSGTIDRDTPREIPIRKVTIPPKDDDGSGPR